ncbi:hypothetical protein BD626DRAFT_495859 [Schizophyllum amplum]|uniref:Uncharacterized protein n=1 Tax=Schizophyllum amplum TaxID=97359 RepID=A0A550CEH8_9AGAR|nr:hypothetical protein BD626DRAFT_495859 [Auriculariopsis ampla]
MPGTMNQNGPIPTADANGKIMPSADDGKPMGKPAYARKQSDPHHAPQRPGDAYTAQHNEALRMALGSILSPKRPFTPSSGPASGTASPAFFHALPFTGPGSQTPAGHDAHHHHHPQQSHQPHHPPQAHQPHHGPHHHLHSHWYPHHQDAHHHYHPHPSHTPSRLGAGEEHTGSQTSRPVTQSTGSHPASPGEPSSQGTSPLPSPAHEVPPAVNGAHAGGMPAPAPLPADAKVPVPTAPAPASGGVPTSAGGTPSSGTGTPRAKFLDTLHGKSAWDALIHGSFS